MPRQSKQPWVFKCPVCEFDHVKIYSAKGGVAAYVVCGRCRTLKTFDHVSKYSEPIDLYNAYCDAVRSRMGSYVAIPSPGPIAEAQGPSLRPMKHEGEAEAKVVFAVPLCETHEFVIGEPIRGFQGEMLAATRICLRCGHAEREKV